MTHDTRCLGRRGEAAAAAFLEQSGHRILTLNYTTRFAEIDIIAQIRDTLIFVEVKTRSSHRKGFARESVPPAKQHKIIQAARHYLRTHPGPVRARFDVVVLQKENDQWAITHIPNAFQTDSS